MGHELGIVIKSGVRRRVAAGVQTLSLRSFARRRRGRLDDWRRAARRCSWRRDVRRSASL
eukprot:7342179-Lingulodinium_polyedra.AAC.1